VDENDAHAEVNTEIVLRIEVTHTSELERIWRNLTYEENRVC
jgi:hypothetical protein